MGIGTFQPSELAKLAVLFFVAWWFEKFEKDSGRFFKGFIFPMAIVSIILVPISRQEDLGYTALIGAVVLCMMFMAGMKLRWIAPIVIAGDRGDPLPGDAYQRAPRPPAGLSQSGGIPGKRRLPASCRA